MEALSSRDHQYVNLCPTFSDICDNFLDGIACPTNLRSSVGCTDGNDYNTYVGKCMCGNIDVGDRVRRLVSRQMLPALELQT